MRLLLLCLLLLAAPLSAQQPSAADFRADALSIDRLILENYAYPERFPGGAVPSSALLAAEAARVGDRRSLLRYAERALLALADHHAITGASFADSWAVVPSFADLWIERRGDGAFVVEAVRAGSPAESAGARPGDVLFSVGSEPIGAAVAAFWRDLGLPDEGFRAAFAARVLAAGRRNAPRRLTLSRGGRPIPLELPSLYAVPRGDRPPVSVERRGGGLRIRFNDSLGDDRAVAAFDAAMAGARRGERVAIDLTDTPSGGNTIVARAVLGWFVDRARPYQRHNLPAEQRRTGIARQWVEEVLPRSGRFHRGPVTVEVGRWTGSMGEGLALGFDAIGAEIVGGRMAGLLGAIYDHRLPHSGLILKLPTERLSHIDGTPREAFVPRRAARR
ncbi:MAG TPA: PDZ domain-containing protein [Allosphingosinicella sp.]|jgi:carboxyl-terminal processing protease